MARVELNELTAFVAVAEHRSFAKAAAQVGISAPSMSQTIRSMEERLGVRLLNRTTRSVALTEAGSRLLIEVRPILEGIDHALESVNAFRDKPMGTLRLAAIRPFAMMLIAPLIQPFLEEYRDIRMEIALDNTHSDIVREGFDAGVRVGNRVERDMTALRLTNEFRVLVVASPTYMAGRTTPKHPSELTDHNCIKYRAPWDGSVISWDFDKGGEHVETGVDGSLTVNDIDMLLSATLSGAGMAFLPEPLVAPYIASGRLVALMPDWSAVRDGIFLYYPAKRQTPMPLLVFLRFIEKWRKQEKRKDGTSR